MRQQERAEKGRKRRKGERKKRACRGEGLMEWKMERWREKKAEKRKIPARIPGRGISGGRQASGFLCVHKRSVLEV